MKDFMVHQARTLAAITEISRLFSSTLDYKLVAYRCLQSLSNNLDLENGTFLMPSPERKHLIIHASCGHTQEQIRSTVYVIGVDLVGKIYSTGMPMVIPNDDALEDFSADHKVNTGPLYKVGFIGVPVLRDGVSIGVITANRTPQSSTMLDEDIQVMKTVASMLSQTIRMAEMVRDQNEKLVQENEELHAELEERYLPENLISNSGAMAKTLEMVKRVAATDASILLRGESGTGKTLLAKSIHYSSLRKKNPFMVVNCAALPPNLIESELFGHEKGSFTGAVNQRIGRFEAADGGTLFLDEVGELSPETQAKLLRIIQDGTFERVGSSKTMTADVRLICATNANLETLIRERKFREDLYYRLMVVPINVPALRNRKEDILSLVSYFLKKFTAKYNKRISVSREAMDFLEAYHWPGNVRELENTIERTVVLAGGETLAAKDIPILNSMLINEDTPAHESNPVDVLTFSPTANPVRERQPYERVPLLEKEVVGALEKSRGIQTHAARMLGVSLRQFRYALQKFSVDADSFRA